MTGKPVYFIAKCRVCPVYEEEVCDRCTLRHYVDEKIVGILTRTMANDIDRCAGPGATGASFNVYGAEVDNYPFSDPKVRRRLEPPTVVDILDD